MQRLPSSCIQIAVLLASLCLFDVRDALAQATKAPEKSTNRSERLRDFLGLDKAPDAAAAGRGAPIYTRNCAFCHGANARGAEGPDLVRSRIVLHDENGDQIGDVVTKGRVDRGMPAFPSLTRAEIGDIAAFLHQQIELAANRGTYQLQNVVTGNADDGERYFNGAGRCSSCHSVSGDLAHIASKYEPADLQSAFLYPASVKNMPRKATITLPSGEQVEGTLKMLDDFDVTLIDGKGVSHSWARKDGLKVEAKDPLLAHQKLLSQYSNADMHNLLSYLVKFK